MRTFEWLCFAKKAFKDNSKNKCGWERGLVWFGVVWCGVVWCGLVWLLFFDIIIVG